MNGLRTAIGIVGVLTVVAALALWHLLSELEQKYRYSRAQPLMIEVERRPSLVGDA